MKTTILTQSLLLSFFFVSCGQMDLSEMNDENNYYENSKLVEEVSAALDDMAESEYDNTAVNDNLSSGLAEKKISQPLKIIKNADSRFLVKNVDSISQLIIKLAKMDGGYVSNMSFNQNRYEIENNLTIAIPSEVFEEFISKASRMADFIDYNNITSKDVTEEFVDLSNRIKVKEEVKARYEQILRSKTKTVKEVLETERQIQLIQEEIESAKGRLNYINTKSAMSSVKMSLYEKVSHQEHPEVYSRTFGNKSKNAFKTGWEIIQNLVLALIYIWPILLILSITYFLIRRRWKKKKSKA